MSSSIPPSISRLPTQHRLLSTHSDWEPTKGVTARDALDYAAFLDLLASELHAVGAQVTVDFATWSPIWNLTALAATGVDRFMDMGTYTDSPDSWKRQLQVALQALPHDKIVVGACVRHARRRLACQPTPLPTPTQVLKRPWPAVERPTPSLSCSSVSSCCARLAWTLLGCGLLPSPPRSCPSCGTCNALRPVWWCGGGRLKTALSAVAIPAPLACLAWASRRVWPLGQV